jgi:hypothetical protein
VNLPSGGWGIIFFVCEVVMVIFSASLNSATVLVKHKKQAVIMRPIIELDPPVFKYYTDSTT